MSAPSSPQLRFLLRGSILFLVMLTLWWWLLLHPLLFGMRLATGATAGTNGDWLLRVPIPQWLAKQEAVQRAYGRAPGAPAVNVRSFKLEVPERIPTFFTLGLPLFWALVLAAPRASHFWRILGVGTGLLILLALISLLVYTACTILAALHLVTSSWTLTFCNAVEYLNLNVTPYLAPLLLAVWLHTELRTQIFLWNPAAEPKSPVLAGNEKPRRGRYRAC